MATSKQNTTKTNQLNNLFDQWENSIQEYKGRFVKDEIIDEELYDKAKHKILFITKEPNNPEQEPGDFRDWWKNELIYTFSYRIAEWSYGLLNDFPQYDEIWSTKDAGQKAVQSVSLMNIKKSGGKGNSEYNEMMQHLSKNFEFLHQEIDIINPEIIIIGVTWKELRIALFPDIQWQNSGYGILIGKHKNAKVIDYYHPSSRNAPPASYSLLQNIIRSSQFKSL